MDDKMRAWAFTSRGQPRNVLRLTTISRPSAKQLTPNELLVKVYYAGLFQSSAMLMSLIPHINDHPWIPYSDFSGIVCSVGSEVSKYHSGDMVFGFPDPRKWLTWGSRYNGALAEYIIVNAEDCVLVPDANAIGRVPDLAGLAGVIGNGCAAVQFCELAELRQGSEFHSTSH